MELNGVRNDNLIALKGTVLNSIYLNRLTDMQFNQAALPSPTPLPRPFNTHLIKSQRRLSKHDTCTPSFPP